MNDFVVSLLMLGAMGTSGNLPFWAVSNQYGLMPEVNGGLAVVQAYVPFDQSKSFQWQAGVSLAANYAPVDPLNPESTPFHPMVDELYAGIRWNVLRLDLGMKHRDMTFLGSDRLLGSLSATSGSIVESGNARSMPGYSLILEPWAIPFTGGHLKIQGLWGDYKTIDDRYVDGALVHRLQGFVTFDTLKHFYITLGLDHYALWGGTSPKFGPMAITFDNYFRICTGRSAGSDGTVSDQINVLGDHGGAERLAMGWREKDWRLDFQWEKPYSDKSGMRLMNIPDGVYTLHWSLNDKDHWVTDFLAEFHYTMWQSGPVHLSETDEHGVPIPNEDGHRNTFGGDNYFTNGEYVSGWTHFGRAICCPLFLTETVSGIRQIENTRYRALHFGLSGKLFRAAPYKLMLTLSDNYRNYSKPYKGVSTWVGRDETKVAWNWWEPNTVDEGIGELSAAFTGYIPFNVGRRSRIDATYGLYFDYGHTQPAINVEGINKNFGAIIGVRYTFR